MDPYITRITKEQQPNRTEVVRLESEFLVVEVAPSIGGRITSITEKKTNYQFLWRNDALPLEAHPPGTAYDPVFWGGVDEILPSDVSETVDGENLPDHGELWTTSLSYSVVDDTLVTEADLPVSGLRYKKTVSLRPDSFHCDLDYELVNVSDRAVQFQWRIHAPLKVKPGDRILCPASRARVAELSHSRFQDDSPFDWPILSTQPVNVVPEMGDEIDSFHLWDLAVGVMSWHNAAETLSFGLTFDTDVFPYGYVFASYGGFQGGEFVILEPSAASALSLNEAIQKQECATLAPGEQLETRVAIYAGTLSPEKK
ncbi:MAG: DUF5107 domain-containing protein [Armatimonadetes bacterium]|nr:DUF5107 domain-containing protein [Armatimonadota bacterium]